MKISDTPETRVSQEQLAIRYLTIREVSAQLGIHAKTVHALILRGQLPAMKWGVGKSVWRVAKKDLEAFLRDRERRTRAELHPVIRFGGRG